MVDVNTLKTGARLKVISTNELVDYLGNSAGLVIVIRPSGVVANVSPDDIELVALP